jgi:hypothetical protein
MEIGTDFTVMGVNKEGGFFEHVCTLNFMREGKAGTIAIASYK